MFKSITSKFSMFPKPRPPPQNFRVIHKPKDEEGGFQKKPTGPLPSNVYIAPEVPEHKPAPNWLRVVCISDTHNTTDVNNFTIPEADVLVHAGDFTKMGTTAQVDQFICWMKSLTNIPLKIIIAGNHEVVLDKEFYEKNWNIFHTAKEDSQAVIDKLNSAGNGIVYLDNSSFQIDGARILYKKWQKQGKKKSKQHQETATNTSSQSGDCGVSPVNPIDPRHGWDQGYKVWGSPWQPEFFDWAFNEERGKLHVIWDLIPDDTDILVTHGPPKFHGDTVSGNSDVHAGCQELLDRLEAIKPSYHIFGHIHEGYGVSQINWISTSGDDNIAESVPSTICINASTCTVKYRPLHMPIVIDLPPK